MVCRITGSICRYAAVNYEIERKIRTDGKTITYEDDAGNPTRIPEGFTRGAGYLEYCTHLNQYMFMIRDCSERRAMMVGNVKGQTNLTMW